MLSSRGRQIIGLLREGPRSGAELACHLGISRRTVVRDVALLNDLLVSAGAGSIEAEPSYHLTVSSERALSGLLTGDLSDRDRVIVGILTTHAPTLSQLAADTYLSRRAVQRAISQINEDFADVVRVEAHVGHGVVAHFASASPVDFMAALAIENPGIISELERVSDWEGMRRLLEVDIDEYLAKVMPYVTPRQARVQELCAIACAPSTSEEPGSWSVARAKSVRAFQAEKASLLFDLIRRRSEIVALVVRLLSEHGIKSTREDLSSLIFDHIIRCSLFPTLMPPEMRDQMREMRMKHPFEFDFGADLCECLRRFNPHLLMEADFLALYVLASTEGHDAEPVRIVLLCRRRSVAAINKYLIEQASDAAEIHVVGSEDEAFAALAEDPGFDLVVADEVPGDGSCPEGALRRDLVYQGILTSNEVEQVKKLIRRIGYQKGIANLLPRSSFVRVGGSRPYLEALEDGLAKLVVAGALGEHEARLVVERECQGARLQFGGVAFPHAITPEPSRTFRLLAICPDDEVEDEGEHLGFILVVLASQRQVDKSSIFSYLFTTLEGIGGRGRRLPTTWEEALDFFGNR